MLPDRNERIISHFAGIKNWPKISVVTPSYNQAGFLEETILSVTNQNYPNLEYIVIDGGSTDGSVDIIKKHESKLSYWSSEKDNGLYDAINKGFKVATGEILMWINSDDLLMPMSLFSVGEIFMKHSEVNWITGISVSLDERSRIIGADRAKSFSKFDFYTYNFYWLQQESTAWRKSLWDEAGGYISTDLSLAADLELWVRFFRKANLYPADVMIGSFRMRASDQKSLDGLDDYLAQAKRVIDDEIKTLDTSTRASLKRLNAIAQIKKILHHTYIFDLDIIRRVLDKISRDIHKRPRRIQIDRFTQEFTIV
nr:glycosyltransferase family 2 protein [uncultured Mucilaginibacter sp.]